MDKLADPILEEHVEYYIYPDPVNVSNAQRVYKGDPANFMLAYLHALRSKILSVVPPLTWRYLWHDQPFNLSVKVPKESYLEGKVEAGVNDRGEPCLHGRVVFGDGIEDEWFITFVLLQVSKTLPGLIISLRDADCEFLLVEAAEHLPDWLEPEVSDHRVFISGGRLHIIDIRDIPRPSLAKSLQFLRRNPLGSVASNPIQAAIEERVCKYHLGVQEVHHARLVVPKRLAMALSACPALVSTVAKAFVCHNPVDTVKASTLQRVRGDDGALDLHSIRVAFPRTLFAQLLCQRIHPPRGYPMPAEQSPDHLAHDLGLKLALGAELVQKHHEEEHGKKQPFIQISQEKAEIISFELDRDIGSYLGIGDELYEAHSIPPLQLLLRAATTRDFSSLPPQYHGPDDDMSWLDIDEGPIMNDIASKLKGIQLTEEESERVVQMMLDEEENPPDISSRLMEFMKASSGLDGIYYDPREHQSDSERSSDDELDSEQEDSGLEDDADFLEREIMETLLHDPDLLMKLLERSTHLGLDCKELLAKLQTMDRKAPPPPASSKQKGVADIDPTRLAQARARPPNRDHQVKAESEEDPAAISSEEDLTEQIYDGSVKPPASTLKESLGVNSDPDGDEASMSSYMQAMDEHLLRLAPDRKESSVVDLVKATETDSSPAHALVLSIKQCIL